MSELFSTIVVEQVTRCMKLYTLPADPIRVDGRKEHGIVCFIEGECDYLCGERKLSTSPGSLLYLPQGCVYTICRKTPGQFIFINFQSAHPYAAQAVVLPRTTKQVYDCFCTVLNAFKQRRIGYGTEAMSVLYRLFSLLQIADSSTYLPQSKYEKIAPAIEYIQKNYALGTIQTRALAAQCGISTRYFNRLFAAFFGVAPKEYILRLRLELAQNLLVSSAESVGSISEICGFPDVYYFSRLFKKRFSISPNRYRKANELL